MNINLKRAVKTFYPNPSLEQVYYEAIANALDAGADKIQIAINIDAFDKADSLQVTIQDNGRGFTDADFKKFSSLLEADSQDHKGLGRLVYLAYFDEVFFDSHFDGDKRRTFSFTGNFNGESSISKHKAASGTTVIYRQFAGEKIKSYAYVVPDKLKASILEHFFPTFFTKKGSGQKLEIAIELYVKQPNPDYDFVSGTSKLTLDDLPPLKKESIQDAAIDFFQKIDIHYSITHDLNKERSISTSICVDGRSVSYDLIPIESVPAGYQLVFLFISDYFVGKTNTSRQKLELPDEITERALKATLRRETGRIINTEIPAVVQENRKTEEDLSVRFPHLAGYYPKVTAGLIVKDDAIEEAQKAFFNDQKKLLECEVLDEENFEKALELSARALMEYVLYRARIIDKLKTTDPKDPESAIHKLIVPMKKTLQGDKLIEDIYSNNVWMLDDKYMSYDTVLSDQTMQDVIQHIALDKVEDEGRPDITLVFSGNLETSEKVSVVVVELKRHGVELAKKEEVVSQLRQRARKLLKYLPDKIERIWFYGITDIDQDFRVSLKEDQFKELFSHGQVFYKPQPVIVNDEATTILRA